MKNLTDVVTYPGAITVPEGGDTRTASTVETPFQQLANRTAYLLHRVDVSGTNRIQYVATIGDALLLSELTEGDLVVVWRLGLYIFHATAAHRLDVWGAPWQYYQATSGGYLVRIDVGSIARDEDLYRDCIVVTDSNGRLRHLDAVTNRTTFESSKVSDSGATNYMITTSDTNWHPLVGVSGDPAMSITTPAVAAGDKIAMTFTGSVVYSQVVPGTWGTVSFRTKYDNGSTPVYPNHATAKILIPDDAATNIIPINYPVVVTSHFTATSSTPYTVSVEYALDTAALGGADIVITNPCNMSLRVTRA